MSQTVSEPVSPVGALKGAALFASEAIIPGGSNLVNGNIKEGLLYAAVGTFAKAVFGLPVALLVSASSFTKSTTGKHLTQLVPVPRLITTTPDPKVADLTSRIAQLEAQLAATAPTGPKSTTSK